MSRRSALLAFVTPLMAQSPGGVTAADDGYHFKYWNAALQAFYTEWWYFNFFDESAGVQAIFSYLVQNPGGAGMAEMAAVAITPQGQVLEDDVFPVSEFSASYQRADVQLGGNSVQAVTPTLYRITGASRDGRLSWDLLYARTAAPWFAANRASVGPLAWEQMSWLVYMPAAEVRGSLVVDGRVYAVDCTGYHDHNWGEWNFVQAMWNWAQCSQSGVVFDLGDFIGQATGFARIAAGGDDTVFSKSQYSLTHLRWAYDAANQLWYPVKSAFQATSATRRVQLTMTALTSVPLAAPFPPPLPEVVIYEQTAHFSGSVWNSAGGAWTREAAIDADGFKEYTASRPQPA